MGERKDKCKIPSEVATRLSWIDIAHLNTSHLCLKDLAALHLSDEDFCCQVTEVSRLFVPLILGTRTP